MSKDRKAAEEFACEFCPRVFPSRRSRAGHMNSHKKRDGDQSDDNAITGSAAKVVSSKKDLYGFEGWGRKGTRSGTQATVNSSPSSSTGGSAALRKESTDLAVVQSAEILMSMKRAGADEKAGQLELGIENRRLSRPAEPRVSELSGAELVAPASRSRPDISHVRPQHQCEYCFRIFQNSRALGGHRRWPCRSRGQQQKSSQGGADETENRRPSRPAEPGVSEAGLFAPASKSRHPVRSHCFKIFPEGKSLASHKEWCPSGGQQPKPRIIIRKSKAAVAEAFDDFHQVGRFDINEHPPDAEASDDFHQVGRFDLNEHPPDADQDVITQQVDDIAAPAHQENVDDDVRET